MRLALRSGTSCRSCCTTQGCAAFTRGRSERTKPTTRTPASQPFVRNRSRRMSAQNTSGRRSAIDGRTTRHAGYATSQRVRKRIEEAFGWIKTVAGQAKTRFRGVERVELAFTFAAAAYNLVRLPKLLAESS